MYRNVEQIIKDEKKNRKEEGEFGIKACKDAILWEIKFAKEYEDKTLSLYELLEKYVNRANTEALFNARMVLACWEMINGKW